MKLGSFEGTTDELQDVCENHGFNASDFLNTPTRYQPKVWALILFVILFTISNIILWTIELSTNWDKIFIISNLILTIIIAVAVHLRFEKWPITVITFLGGLIILSVSLGYVTPKEAIDEMKEKLINEKTN